MEEFIASVDNPRVRAVLDDAIRGRGAFRRFKDALSRYSDERQRWFDFKAARLEARARVWLTEEGCEPMPIGRPV
jgi:hypothetical protein